jgi:hypothetical protein
MDLRVELYPGDLENLKKNGMLRCTQFDVVVVYHKRHPKGGKP